MHQCWTNPSVIRSTIRTTGMTSSVTEFMKVSYSDGKEILIFPDMEYTFTFFDPTYGTIRTLKALVTKVYEDQIKIKYVPENTIDCVDCTKCKNPCNKKPKENEPPMPTCNCILNPPDTSKYDEPKIYFIPVTNLIEVTYIKCDNSNSSEDDKKGDEYVMLLGISATMLKAIIVRLEFFDDAIQDAVKYVDIEAEGVYDFAYEGRDGTVYEARAKVIKIEEDADGCTPCKPGKGFVRENINGGNVIYTSCCDHHDKTDFMQEPPVPKVKIIVDTSESFTGRYEVIMLHSIRDCKLVQAPDGSDPMPEKPTDCCDSCHHKTHDCNPSNCGHYLPPPKEEHKCHCNSDEKYTYNYENHMKAVIEGEDVSIFIKGEKTKINLDTLVRYYLGVD